MTISTKRTKRMSWGLVLMGLAITLTLGCENNIQIREKGLRSMRQQDLAGAEEQFARAAERKPTDFLAHYYLGEARIRQNRGLGAQLALEKALSIEPRNPEWTPLILDKLAEAIYIQGRQENLQAFLEQTVKTYGKTRDYLRQAEYLVKIGDLDGAKLAYRKAAYFADPKDESPYLGIAAFYESIHDVPNAVAALRYAYYVNPANPKVAAGLRRFGVVPGPTVAEAPPKPELLQ